MEYKQIPDNCIELELHRGGGYCCDMCQESWVIMQIWSKINETYELNGKSTFKEVLLWESDAYDTSDMLDDDLSSIK